MKKNLKKIQKKQRAAHERAKVKKNNRIKKKMRKIRCKK